MHSAPLHPRALTVSLLALAVGLGLVAVSATSASAATPLAACTTYGSVYTSDLATWNTSDTRATGHQAIQPAGGLHLFTEGATSTDKVAGYFPTNFALSAVGAETIAQAMDFSGLVGATVPGLQLVVDINGDGVADGNLVGEPIYGNTWWLNTSASAPFQALAPHTGGGFGSSNWGELSEWSAAIPAARVLAIGYSLGSGVHNDGVLTRITLGCVNYTWGPVITTNANAAASVSGSASATAAGTVAPIAAVPALAATGASPALPIGIAAVLLASGSVVFWLRRRRVA
jgi:hypothetical protein